MSLVCWVTSADQVEMVPGKVALLVMIGMGQEAAIGVELHAAERPRIVHVR